MKRKLLLHALLPVVAHATNKGTVITERSTDAGSVTANIDGLTPVCTFVDEITISHPMSMHESDKFFKTGQLQMKAIQMMTDYVNVQRCGVELPDGRHSLKLRTYGDDSDKVKVEAIANHTVSDTDFFVGPYSSGLTEPLGSVAQENSKVLIAGGAAKTTVFSGRDGVFGTFPPTAKYLSQAVKGLSEKGAASIATVSEDASFTKAVCAAVPDLATEHSMTLKSEHIVTNSPTQTEFAPVVDQFVDEDPDVVVTCVYAAGCTEWIRAMRSKNWSPKAQVFTVCIGISDFEEQVGTDAEHMMGVSPWDASLPVNDTVTGWSASDFSERFLKYSSVAASYHAASAAASLAIFVDVIERTESLDAADIKAALASESFTTLYGDISFDENGQSNAPSLLLQYDEAGAVQTVYPEESSSGPLNYPMPSWGYRDCMKGDQCTTSGGTCEQSGLCTCEVGKISFGSGLTASCLEVPDEDMTYLNTGLIMAGYVAVSLQGIASLGAIVWTYWYRDNELVKVSQPVFLRAIALGCFIMAATILPLSSEGGYRYKIDPDTYQLTDEEDPDIESVDAACMALVWLYNMGFILTYSALFAKIWRIKKLFMSSSMKRVKVTAAEVARIMVILCILMICIMAAFQIVSPMQWEREVQYTDANGFSLESVGTCAVGDNSDIFLIMLALFHAMCLLYALALCVQVRNVPDEFAEGKWIMASIFCLVQLMVVALPIVFIVKDNADAFYFVRAGISFVEAFLVTLLIFGPKMQAVYSGSGQDAVNSAVSGYRQSASKSKSSVADGE